MAPSQVLDVSSGQAAVIRARLGGGRFQTKAEDAFAADVVCR